MDDKRIMELINGYFDGDLKKGEEPLLFTRLSESETGREYFKQLNRIRAAVDESAEEFPEELEERILRSLGRNPVRTIPFFQAGGVYAKLSYTIALLMVIISVYLFFKVDNYQDRIDILSDQMIRQSRTVEMLYNTLPDIKVRASFDNEVVIRPKL